MKLKNTLGLALALSLPLMLVGCEAEPDPAATAADEADIDSAARQKLNADEAELKEELKKAQEKDPTIKDMYYSVDDDGQKILHIVRELPKEEGKPAQSHDSAVPMMQGMLLGMLMSNMMNNNYGNYSRQYGGNGSYNSRSYNSSDARRQRNTATSGYVAATRSSAARSYVSSRPSSAYSSRSSGALSSSSSARSSGYSGGG
ncbi:hypothetical protein phiK7A1_022c [Pseudomonas phage phiK7A1]|uniref:Lipoprotein n=1 Tax=Pseudomonas phage phiK7A1 TaxID=2759194 RepID=A0A7H0XFM2_9CAUD|nr:hypothetical protein phiK7A1_022c [Pseudomonas phage phiK7A1]